MNVFIFEMTGEIFTCGKINERLWWLCRKSDAHGPPDAIHTAHITRGHLTSHLCQLLSHLLSCRQKKIKVAKLYKTLCCLSCRGESKLVLRDRCRGYFPELIFFLIFFFFFAWTSSQSGWTRGEWSVVKCTAVEQKDKGCHVPDRVLTQFHLFDTRGQQANHVRRLLGTQTFLLCFLQVSEELCSLIQFLLDFQGICNGQQTCSFMSPLSSTTTCTKNIVNFFLNPAVDSSGLLLF